MSYNNTKEYEHITNCSFASEYGVIDMVKERKKDFSYKCNSFNIIGVLLCIISVIPLFISILLKEEIYIIIGVCLLILLVGCGVFILVFYNYKMATYDALLQEKEYDKESKEKSGFFDALSTIFWLLFTAIYLSVSFLTNKWDITWIIWVIAGILYVVFSLFMKHVYKQQKK